MTPAQIVVLGMHRSGTSSVTNVLVEAGASFGPSERAMAAGPDNPRGFFERRDVYEALEGVFQSLGTDWIGVHHFDVANLDERTVSETTAALETVVAELDADRPWVLKDPRLCVLLPLLVSLLDAPVIVHVSRHPMDVARSLRARNELPLAVGLALWERYVTGALVTSAGLPQVFVSYEELMAEPVRTTHRLLRSLGTAGVEGLDEPPAAAIQAIVDPSLRHHRADRVADDAALSARQLELWRRLEQGETGAEVRPVAEASDDLLAWFHAANRQREEREQQRAELTATVDSAVAHARAFLEEVGDQWS